MTNSKKQRVKFYSIHDGTVHHELKKVEVLLDSFSSTKNFDENDFFEFYNCKIYLENKLFLNSWTEEIKVKYQEIVDFVFLDFKNVFIKIDDSNLENIIKKIDFTYLENFWQLFGNLNLSKNIDGQNFLNILNGQTRIIRYVLQQKNIVEKFDKKIRDFLFEYDKTTELLLAKLEEKHHFGETPNYFFPNSLTINDKEKIIIKYLNGERPNLNYVRLIENSKDSSNLRLSPKTRLNAKKISEKLNNEIIEDGHSWNIRVQVAFSKDQLEPVKFNNTENLFEVVYSETFLNKFLDNDLKLFYSFANLFVYVDDSNLITLVSKATEIDSFERTFMKSKNAYETGETFIRKELLSNLQLIIFENYLKRNKKTLENVINSFIEYLNISIAPNKLYFNIRETETNFIEKIRTVAPDFEFLLKQFKYFAVDEQIDLELIQLDSNPVRISETLSLNENKYIYSNNETIQYLKNVFFSSHSFLHYIDEFKEKYNNLFDLLTNENIKIDSFENYKRREIIKLLSDGYLATDVQGVIKINKAIRLFVIRQLYLNEVINYWHYQKPIRDEIDTLLNEGILKSEKTLFTTFEKNYLNYYLNKKEFTNGFDLRNKYLHGTNKFSENENKTDYFRLLKIIILTLLKIADDIEIWKDNK